MIIMMTDASLLRWGAHLDTYMTQSKWMSQEMMLSICWNSEYLDMPASNSYYKTGTQTQRLWQIILYVWYQLARRSKIPLPLHWGCQALELVHMQPDHQHSSLSLKDSECDCGCIQQTLLVRPWVGNRPQHIILHILSMEHPSDRLVHHRIKQEMHQLLLEGWIGSPILRGCFSPSVVISLTKCIPTDPL